MFTFYGTKKKLAKYYPFPQYDCIIEPFAGAAQYSLYGNNWQKQVLLVDKDTKIISIWNYLIQAFPSDILSLPDLKEGDNVDNFKQLSQEENWLIGFCINPGSACPKKTARARSRWNKNKLDIAGNLYKIKHWKAILGDYADVPNQLATWFIDSPYQYGGEYYRINNSKLDYPKLAEWCLNREGQVIVCENSKADWLPFTPLVELNGQLHKTMEVIYHKEAK